MSRSLKYLIIVFAAGLPLLASACSATESGPATAAANSASSAPAKQPAAQQSADSQVPRITVDQLKQLVADGQAVIVDVRDVNAYNHKHIKGSISLPLEKISAGEHKNLPRDKHIVTYCSCGSEQTSAAAGRLLVQAGFKNVSALLGGTDGWEQSGGAMEKSSPKA
jgi:rhodanese-related sulfurtransferase